MELYVIAGPNGAGKTTFAREFLPNYANFKNFVNADLIAAGMAPFSPDTAAVRAGRMMLAKSRRLPGGVSRLHLKLHFLDEATSGFFAD